MNSEREVVEKFIVLWERYYKFVVQVKPWQKIFNQSDEERLLKVVGKIPALSADMRVFFGRGFDPEERIQYVLKHASSLIAVAAMTPEERMDLFHEISKVMENLKLLGVVPDDKLDQVDDEKIKHEVLQSKMKLSLKKFFPLWSEVMFRPIFFFRALGEMGKFSVAIKFVLTLFLSVFFLALVFGALRPGVAQELQQAMPIQTELSLTMLIPAALAVVSLLVLYVIIAAIILLMLMLLTAVHWGAYRIFRTAECSFGAIFGIWGFALAPMAFLPFATLYPPLILIFLVWSLSLAFIGYNKTLMLRPGRFLPPQAVVIALLAAVAIAGMGTGKRDSCWEATLVGTKVIYDSQGIPTMMFLQGANVRIIFRNQRKVLAMAKPYSKKEVEPSFVCLWEKELRPQKVGPSRYYWLKVRNAGMSLWEKTLSIRRTIAI